MNENKWKFCPDHECDSCGAILDDSDYPEGPKIISSCAECQRSFVE